MAEVVHISLLRWAAREFARLRFSFALPRSIVKTLTSIDFREHINWAIKWAWNNCAKRREMKFYGVEISISPRLNNALDECQHWDSAGSAEKNLSDRQLDLWPLPRSVHESRECEWYRAERFSLLFERRESADWRSGGPITQDNFIMCRKSWQIWSCTENRSFIGKRTERRRKSSTSHGRVSLNFPFDDRRKASLSSHLKRNVISFLRRHDDGLNERCGRNEENKLNNLSSSQPFHVWVKSAEKKEC